MNIFPVVMVFRTVNAKRNSILCKKNRRELKRVRKGEKALQVKLWYTVILEILVS